MKLSIRTETENNTLETPINSIKEAKDHPDKEAFLIINNHDERPYKPCRKIKIKDL